MANTNQMTQALSELRTQLEQVRLPLALPGAAEQTASAREITHQLNDYILPRLADIEAPLLAVIGGSTGAGKSTLVNSLIGRVVSKPGVIRPTTRSPVLVVHPDEMHWFDSDRILPGLIRSRVSSQDNRSLQLVGEPALPRGLAVLDAPDIDSVVAENRALASQLLKAADLWLFVTSAARYADAVPWDYLNAAAERSTAVAVVLDRIPPAAMNDVPADLGRMMTQNGLAESPLFAVPETVVDEQGLLPDRAVAPIRTWLATLAADYESRQRVVMQTLDGAVGSLVARAPAIAEAIDDQANVLDQLGDDAAANFAEATRSVSVHSADGTLLRGEVLTRWHDFVGTSEFARALDQKIGWLRDRITSVFRGSPPEAKQAAVAAESGLQVLIQAEGEAAAERVATAWRSSPAGRQIMADHPELAHPSPGFDEEVARTIRAWQSDVLDLVESEGQDKRLTARFAALGVNGVGAALMIVIFANTAGLTGAELGIAGGTSVLAQRVLEGIFGDDAVRRLAEVAKQNLDARVEGLMASELARFTSLLAEQPTTRERAQAIRDAANQVQAARGAGYVGQPAITAEQTALPSDAEVDQQPAIEATPTANVLLTPTAEPSGEVVDAELMPHPAERREPLPDDMPQWYREEER